MELAEQAVSYEWLRIMRVYDYTNHPTISMAHTIAIR